MKQILLFLALIGTTLSYCQSEIKLTLKGLTEEVNSALQPGELILNLNGLDDNKYVFYAKVQNTSGGSTKYVKIKNSILPNEKGEYDFTIQFDVSKTGSLDLSKEITVTVEGKTTLGNDVWVEKNVLPTDFDKPIWIDNYGDKFRPGHPTQTLMKFSFAAPRKSDSISKVVIAKGDDIKELKASDFHLQVKNVGDESWIINDSPVIGSITSGRTFKYKLDPTETKLDITKPVLIHICSKTKNGGIVWREFTLQPWELGGLYFIGKNYSEDQDCDVDIEVEVIVEEEETEVILETAEPVIDPVVEEEAPVAIIAEKVVKCNEDTLTKQLYLEGGSLCVQNLRVSRGTTNNATLLYDSEYQIEGVTYILKGTELIEYHNKKNHLLSATLGSTITVEHPLGQLKLAPNRKVEFSQKGLYAAKLSEEALIEYKGQQLTSKVTGDKFDIEFDKLGRLRSLTLGKAATWNISNSEINLPENSYLSFKNDNLFRVKVVESTEVKIGEKVFSVVPTKGDVSMQFSTGNILEEFTTGSGHTIMVDGTEVSILKESQVEVKHNGVDYIISSVEVASPVTMDVHKGSKVKSVDVKSGKRLIIENDKVVKVK